MDKYRYRKICLCMMIESHRAERPHVEKSILDGDGITDDPRDPDEGPLSSQHSLQTLFPVLVSDR